LFQLEAKFRIDDTTHHPLTLMLRAAGVSTAVVGMKHVASYLACISEIQDRCRFHLVLLSPPTDA
jgi:hypothetical protein